MPRTIVGLGANLGDRLATMRKAADAIEAFAGGARRSHVYASAPVGPPQPDYLNAAVEIALHGTPHDLLASLLAVERSLGRVRAERWGPRSIDLDVLWIDGLALRTAALIVPHPHLRERAFALLPLLELAPDARDPVTGEAYVVPPGDVKKLDERL